jgi:hypothetical protein
MTDKRNESEMLSEFLRERDGHPTAEVEREGHMDKADDQ